MRRGPELPALDGRECLIDRYAALAAACGALDLATAADGERGPAPALLAALARELAAGAGRYPDFAGERGLRARVAAERARRDGQPTDERDVVITAGATGGVAAALTVLLAPGDELVTFAPGYALPLRVARGRGARVRVAPLVWSRPARAWTFDPAALADVLGPRTRVLLLNSPHSPTGKVFGAHELELVVALCRARGVFLVHDAVYEGFELGAPAPSPRSLLPEATLVVGSASKGAQAPGLRVGWVTAPRALAVHLARLQEATTGGAGVAAQRALADGAVSLAPPRAPAELAAMQARVGAALARLGLELLPAQGGLCGVARAARPGAASDVELADRLLARGLACVPLSEFEPVPATAAALGPAVRVGFARDAAALARLEALAWTRGARLAASRGGS